MTILGSGVRLQPQRAVWGQGQSSLWPCGYQSQASWLSTLHRPVNKGGSHCLLLGTKVWAAGRQFSEVGRACSGSLSVVNPQAPPAGEDGEDDG